MKQSCWSTLAKICLLIPLLFSVNRARAETKVPKRTLISAQHILLGDGTEISPGKVLVQDGKISFVGDTIELGLPADEIEVDTLIPGLVNVSSNSGLAGGLAEVSREITPDFDTYSAIDWYDSAFDKAIDEGVTTLQILPATESVFSGFSCVVKTAGQLETRTLEPAASLVLAISSDPTSRNRSRSRPDSIYVRQPTNRMGVVWIIRNALHKAKNGQPIPGADPNTNTILEGIVSGTHKIISVSRADFDIRSAILLGDTHGFTPTIYGGDETYRMIDEFKDSGLSLVYTALTTTTSALRGSEGTDLRWNVPGKLAAADIRFCLAGNTLLDQARFAVRFGLSKEQAIRAITLAPAEIIGQEEKIGSIAVGKHADLVAFNGDPLQPTSAILWTMVDGEVYGNIETQK